MIYSRRRKINSRLDCVYRALIPFSINARKQPKKNANFALTKSSVGVSNRCQGIMIVCFAFLPPSPSTTSLVENHKIKQFFILAVPVQTQIRWMPPPVYSTHTHTYTHRCPSIQRIRLFSYTLLKHLPIIFPFHGAFALARNLFHRRWSCNICCSFITIVFSCLKRNHIIM